MRLRFGREEMERGSVGGNGDVLREVEEVKCGEVEGW